MQAFGVCKRRNWTVKATRSPSQPNDTMIGPGVYNKCVAICSWIYGSRDTITQMAILDERTLDFVSSSVAQTVRLGVRLGEMLEVGDLVCLSGELGAGKTAMAQGIGRGWGASRHVSSPSYTLIHEYPRLRDGRLLFHIDCYRLESPADVATSGLQDVLDNGGADHDRVARENRRSTPGGSPVD